MIYTLEEKKLIIKYIKFLLLKEIQKNNYWHNICFMIYFLNKGNIKEKRVKNEYY
jgi:hypothetical protein